MHLGSTSVPVYMGFSLQVREFLVWTLHQLSFHFKVVNIISLTALMHCLTTRNGVKYYFNGGPSLYFIIIMLHEHIRQCTNEEDSAVHK